MKRAHTDSHLRSFEEIHQEYLNEHQTPTKRKQIQKTTQEKINVETFKIVKVKEVMLKMKSPEVKTKLNMKRGMNIEEIFFHYFDSELLDLLVVWNVEGDKEEKLPKVLIT